MRILLIEDHSALAANIGEYLSAAGDVVDFATDGPRGLRLAAEQRYDVIALDIGLPRLDGMTLCQRLREDFGLRTPVLMLTARDTLEDKLAGFRAGADDYLTKPFELAELRARLDALVRRASATGTVLTLADLVFDTGTRLIERGGIPVHLSPTAQRILELLLRRSPQVVSRAELAHHIWGDEVPDAGAALRFHIHSLRNSIDKPYATPLLQTVSGIGYRMVDESAS